MGSDPQPRGRAPNTVVAQPASIGALPVVVARDMGCPVAYLPGLTMRRIADLFSGEAKTDAGDAFVIADAARVMPHTLRSVDLEDETLRAVEQLEHGRVLHSRPQDPFQRRMDLRQQAPKPLADPRRFAGQVVIEADDHLQLGDGQPLPVLTPEPL